MKRRWTALGEYLPRTFTPLSPAFLVLALLVPIIMTRTYFILAYGSSSPFWDQWDAEVDNLLLPLLRGDLGFGHLVQAHNEHRILFTRLISLVLFKANDGQFDAKVEMLFNVIPHAAAVGAMAWVGLRTLQPAARPLLVIAVTLIAALPFGWENLIAGFQNQFFILSLLSVVTIWLSSADALGRNRLLAMVICATLSLFTMASGVFAAAAAAGLLIYRLVAQDIERRSGLQALGLMLVIVVAGVLTMPSAPHGDAFHARSMTEFGRALLMTLSWPLRPRWISVLVLWLPTAILAVHLVFNLRHRFPIGRGERFAFAIAGWVVVQAVAMAYSRGVEVHNGVTSRYTDLLAIGVINNVWLVLHAAFGARSTWRTPARALVPAVFFGWLVISSFPIASSAWAAMEHRAQTGRNQEDILRRYLMDGDGVALSQSPDLLPYPDADRIATTLSTADAAGMMPAEIRRPLALRWDDCPELRRPGAFHGLPLDTSAVGTYDPVTGDKHQLRCITPPFVVKGGTLAFSLAGGAGTPGLHAKLTGPEGEVLLARGRVPGDRWRAQILRVAPGLHHLELEDSHDGSWLAISRIVEVGPLTALRLWLTERTGRLMILALVAWIALFAAALAMSHARRTEAPR